MKSTLRLFKALPVENKTKKENKELLRETVKRGFIFAPEVVANYPDTGALLRLVESVGLSAKQMNNSFHKSWKKVKDADIEQLFVEQIMHYITTYGYEELGIYTSDTVFIPNEELDLPDLALKEVRLTVIKGLTKKELKDRLLKVLNSGIALSEETLQDVFDVATFVGVNEDEIEEIQNREAKISLYDHFGLVPKSPVEFLRMAVYKVTSKTLLIKSKEVVADIKARVGMNVNSLFKKYEAAHGLNKLAEIFFRYKPLFLSFRNNKDLKKTINRIRRLANKHHKPFKTDFLNSVTARLSERDGFSVAELEKELADANIFRKIRLAYALKFRTTDSNSILYRLRNGKGYATEFEFDNKEGARKTLDVVVDSIAKDLKKNVKGKTVYIPKFINYSLPATEKQFTGEFPSGTYVSVPTDMVFGVHWNNVSGHRIDLDLSLILSSGQKVGWDRAYKTEDRSVLFSGDVTNASGKNGASELFYVAKAEKRACILVVNYFNYNSSVEVPIKILVAKETPKDFKENYTVNPNNVVVVANSKIDKEQKVVGILISDKNESRFYFAESYIGKSITSSGSDFVENAKNYLVKFYEDTIKLEDVLVKAGADVIREKDEDTEIDVDLSPENLAKDTILKLLTN